MTGMHIARLRRAALWGGLAAIAALPLLSLYVNTAPLTVDITDGEATIHFETDRSRLLFPGQCARLSWDVRGVETVYVNQKERSAQDSTTTCDTDSLPTLSVITRNQNALDYPLPVEKLYFHPLVAGVWIAVTLGLAGAAYSLFGISGAVFILSVIAFWGVTRVWIETGRDYAVHLHYQQIVLNTGFLPALPPHPLYYLLGLSGAALFPGLSLEDSNLVLLVLAYGFGSIALYGLLKAIVGESGGSSTRQMLVYIPLTMSLWCVVPLVTYGSPLNTTVGRPDIPMNMFNNPTLTVLKPFALLAFQGLLKWAVDAPKRRWLAILGVAIAVAAATLTKPNYTMALLPAVVLLLGYGLIKPLRLNRALIIGGIIIPAIAVLGWQYFRTYAPGAPTILYTAQTPGRIELAPLALFSPLYWDLTIRQLLAGLAASIVFPLIVYLVYFKSARRSLTLNLAWVIFLIGQSVAYLFIEIPYQSTGNMTWGGRITLLVLFTVSLGFFVRHNASIFFSEKRLPHDPRFYLCVGVYLLHIIPYLQYAHVKLP
jgi:hypothetical protein